MAREYAQVLLSIWQDDDWRSLSPQAQHLYFVLLTHPSLTLAGVGDWRPKRIAALAGGWTAEDVEAAGAELAHRLYVVIDLDTEEYLIRSFHRNDNCLRMPNMAVGSAREAMNVASAGIRGVLVHELHRLKKDRPEMKGWGVEALVELMSNPSVDPSVYPCWNPSVYPSVEGSVYPSVNPCVKGSVEGSVNPSANPSVDPSASGGGTLAVTHRFTQALQTAPSNHQPRGGQGGSRGESETVANNAGSVASPKKSSGGVTRGGDAARATPTPDQWSTKDDPRCKTHAGLPRDQVPACRACGEARKWFEEKTEAEAAARLAATRACDLCDEFGFIQVGTNNGKPTLMRCDHTAPKTPPESRQKRFQPQSDPTTRKRALDAAKRRTAQESTTPPCETETSPSSPANAAADSANTTREASAKPATTTSAKNAAQPGNTSSNTPPKEP